MEGRHRRAGPHEHAHVDALGQLGQQRADDDRRLARTTSKCGARCQPVMCTKSRAFCIASAIVGSACAPSTRTSSEQPSRGGGSPAAHRPSSGGSSARSQPRRRRRRRCLTRHGGLDRVADGGVGVAHQRYGHRWRSCPTRRPEHPRRSRRCAARALRRGESASARRPRKRHARERANWVGNRRSPDWQAHSERNRSRHDRPVALSPSMPWPHTTGSAPDDNERLRLEQRRPRQPRRQVAQRGLDAWVGERLAQHARVPAKRSRG